MGYVGNQQTEGFSQVPAKQDLTGATGTSLTLTHAVASAEGIDLFINNVRQEPTTAYSVVGTAVTLTGSVVATDDIYVVYNSLALQTTVPPDASVSTAKIIDGDVTSAKLDTNIAISGDLTVDTSTLKVDSTNNRVGIGTASPTNILHVSGTAGTPVLIERTNGAVCTLAFKGNTTTNNPYLGVNGDDLYFNTGTSEAMRIDSSGDVLINTASTTGHRLQVQDVTDVASFRATSSNSGQETLIQFKKNNSEVGYINVTTSSTVYGTASDYRLKENVTATWDATTRLKQLNPVRFNFIADADTTVDGFLAHEVQTVVPEAISGTHNEVDDEGNPVYQGIDQSKLVPLLVKTIQELETRITALEAN